MTFSPWILPSPAYAHAFGALYTLPIPLWLYLYGAASALIVSFLLIGFFANGANHNLPRINIQPPVWLILLFKTLSLGLFTLTILSGLFGSQSPVNNFAVNFFWIIFLLGMTYLCAIFGNLWSIVNPWKIVLSFFGKLKPAFAYPKSLGYFPALIFYFILIWLELLSDGLAVKPIILSQILIIYSIVTFLFAYLFGADWFKYGEFFSIFFNLIGKISFFQKSDHLLDSQYDHFSLLLFILFMLSSTAFDGFRATTAWANQTIMLLISPLLFLSFYLLAIVLMKLITKTKLTILNLSLDFAYSLIPIAVAYNVAHYYTLLITQGQTMIALLSDPLNLGWNLFMTADYASNLSLLKASFVWHSEVVVIIVGHILAVFFAHLIALRIFNKKQAIISQIPMLILMIGYTITGLWILSQPLIVGTR